FKEIPASSPVLIRRTSSILSNSSKVSSPASSLYFIVVNAGLVNLFSSSFSKTSFKYLASTLQFSSRTSSYSVSNLFSSEACSSLIFDSDFVLGMAANES
ncbi:hypothetical protein PanWU01x14_222410, partial [Parasponia andersonii]